MPYIQVKDLEMFYEKMGNGDTIIFLHSGYSRGILAFAGQMLDFQKKYTCYFPDFRGHGRTRCASLEWSTPQISDDILEFMNQLGIIKAHFIGYSLGANVGLYLAVNHPERVSTLTTIGTGGFCDPTGAEEFEPEWMIEKGLHDMINQMIERHEEAHKGNWEEHMRQSAQDWRLYPQLTENQLSSIECPALFITGEHDPFAGEERVKRLASLVKGSNYFVVPGGSHRPHMVRENPILVNDTILQFLVIE
ncbi:alpha/beta hydrolase [Paenibacillus doosanensis]|uniref:alpha/beta fold hydrolase n=1 Tax=Paenibacillus doosanensis TaxID=1229154 RepID=UPI00217F8DE7|nr:alpha/beta hydrolase [Paenibacillus doosanensis]MCS7461495.1 alpha/beta hydrolase [Paenibacillus doosanensis]